jgi:ABC-type uncharacterized transport system permease subunit
MTDRKKVGIGFLITSVIFAVVGGTFLATEVTPQWIALLIDGIGLVAGLLGFKVVYPDKD